jgi:RNA polymerase sigma-70 factor, ECF subfamily
MQRIQHFHSAAQLTFCRRNLSSFRQFVLWRTRSPEQRLKVLKKETDERLLVEAARSDPGRFAELYELNFERVYAFIASRVRDRDVAQDLTAEVFQQALANLGRFEWRGVPFAAWLLRIAANAIADRWKRIARERGTPSHKNSDPDEPGLEDIEHRASLYRLVGSLPADQRRVIVLRFAEEKSIREIAQMLGRTEGAVKQLQFRGIENLRIRLAGAMPEKSGKWRAKTSGDSHG